MKRRAEPFFATQSRSATVCAPDSKIIDFRPAFTANTAASSGTLPAGMPLPTCCAPRSLPRPP